MHNAYLFERNPEQAVVDADNPHIAIGHLKSGIYELPMPDAEVEEFGEYARPHGREYRGVRTKRYTYVRDLTGPWLLYDNGRDPYQMQNLCGSPDAADAQAELESILRRKLAETDD